MPIYTVVDDTDDPGPIQHPAITLVDPDGGPYNPATSIPSGTYAKPASTSTLAARPAATVIGQRAFTVETSGGTLYESLDGSTWTQITSTWVRPATSSFGVGVGALAAATTASGNTGFGYNALNALTSGTQNTASGTQAFQTITTAANNTGFGYGAGKTATGQDNTAVGNFAMGDAVAGDFNVAIGTHTGRYIAGGTGNTLVGSDAGAQVALPLTTALRCTGIGQNALKGMTAQSNDLVGVGFDALAQGTGAVAVGSGAIANGASAIAIGFSASATGANTIAIGAVSSVADQIRLGNSTHTVLIPGSVTASGGSNTFGSTTFSGTTTLSSGNLLVLSSGTIRIGSSLQQTTVGAAGAASALPATPSFYWKIQNTSGTAFVVPVYAAA